MIEVQVDLGTRSYPIRIGAGIFDELGAMVRDVGPSAVLIVTNTTVGPLYAARAEASIRQALPGLPVHTVELPDGECYKDLDHIAMILDGAVQAGLDRRSLMVALGGGVVGDMTGFAASMWMRGIRFLQVPTTLLAQVDSSVGGKTGVNLTAGKNLIGAFHQPVGVLIDPEVLRTLPAREVSAGVAEIIKYGFLGDAQFVSELERDMERLLALEADCVSRVVAHCCRMKADIVRRDEREGGVRATLNLGHTFGHAIEKLTGYGVWLHGEAVAAGTVMAAMLSRELGYLTDAQVERVRSLTQRAQLPVQIRLASTEEAHAAMAGDKKAVGGVIRFVVMRDIGVTTVQQVDPALVLRVMEQSGWGIADTVECLGKRD